MTNDTEIENLVYNFVRSMDERNLNFDTVDTSANTVDVDTIPSRLTNRTLTLNRMSSDQYSYFLKNLPADDYDQIINAQH
jgi:hypothetical protein